MASEFTSSKGPRVQESKGSGPRTRTLGPWDSWTLGRRRWYSRPGRQYRLQRPVISVGNLSLGGRGKTPVAGLLARMLVEAGERPAVLTRGYGRERHEDGVVVVSDGQHVLADVQRSGDEPLMLAHDVPGACVLVCDQRAMAGALAERALGATVHILDDGFQHLQLARDLDIVIVSEQDLQDRPLPMGKLRESPGALHAADAVIFDGDEPAPGAWRSGPGFIEPNAERPAPSAFHLTRALLEPVPLESGRAWQAPGRRVVALAGTARPARFFESLKAAGWVLAETMSFRDHHNYSARDLARIAAAAERAGAPVLTTAKDAMRLLPFRPFAAPIALVPLSVSVEPSTIFREWLFDRLGRNVRA